MQRPLSPRSWPFEALSGAAHCIAGRLVEAVNPPISITVAEVETDSFCPWAAQSHDCLVTLEINAVT